VGSLGCLDPLNGDVTARAEGWAADEPAAQQLEDRFQSHRALEMGFVGGAILEIMVIIIPSTCGFSAVWSVVGLPAAHLDFDSHSEAAGTASLRRYACTKRKFLVERRSEE